MKLNKLYIIILILLLSCSNKDENKMLTEDFQNNNDEPTSIETSTDIDGELNVATIEPSSPFYPLKESIYDIQNQINELKSKVVEYESELHNPSIDIELLKINYHHTDRTHCSTEQANFYRIYIKVILPSSI